MQRAIKLLKKELARLKVSLDLNQQDIDAHTAALKRAADSRTELSIELNSLELALSYLETPND